MTDEIQKREKARRVWRLNKKEGIPVLEALESVNLGKDTYYRLKREHEETWEEEILTADRIQEQLEELDERLQEFNERADQIEQRFDRAEEIAEEADMDANWYKRVAEIEKDVVEQKTRLNQFAEALGWDFLLQSRNSERDVREAFESERVPEGRRVDFGEVARRVEALEGAVKDVRGDVEELRGRIEEVRDNAREKRQKLREKIEREVPSSVFDLI